VITAMLVAMCGGLGAISRFLLDGIVQQRVLGSYPAGTLIVNLSGSFLLGLMVGLHASHRTALLIGTGLLGSYTTFSTWMLEAHRTAQDGQTRIAGLSVVVAIALGLGAAALGRTIGGQL
jgi:CrcB protein